MWQVAEMSLEKQGASKVHINQATRPPSYRAKLCIQLPAVSQFSFNIYRQIIFHLQTESCVYLPSSTAFHQAASTTDSKHRKPALTGKQQPQVEPSSSAHPNLKSQVSPTWYLVVCCQGLRRETCCCGRWDHLSLQLRELMHPLLEEKSHPEQLDTSRGVRSLTHDQEGEVNLEDAPSS